jgi:hypothetical protein
MENELVLKTVFAALTLGSKHFSFDKGQYRMPLINGKKLYETYVSGYHIFKSEVLGAALKAGEVLEAIVQGQPKDKYASVMLMYRGVPVGFLPMYEKERRVGKMAKNEVLRAQIVAVNLKKPSWEQIKIEVYCCEKGA